MKTRIAAMVGLLWTGTFVMGQSQFVELDPVPGQALSTLQCDLGAGAASVGFSFAFATDEAAANGALLDSLTVSLMGPGSSGGVVILTADAGGTAWVPATPGYSSLDFSSFVYAATAFPAGASPGLYETAYDVTVTVPAFLQGEPLTLYFDLFNNNNGVDSRAYIVNLTAVPEPQSLGLVGVGLGLLLFGRKKKHS